MNNPMQLPQEQIDAIIRTKRKAREPKACYPCHTRKVKCDRQLPCDACVKRDHADLCTYERPSKKHQIAMQNYSNQNAPTVKHENTRRHSSMSSAHHPMRPMRQDSSSSIPMFAPSPREPQPPVTIPRHEYDSLRAKMREMEETLAALRNNLDRTQSEGGIMATPMSHNKDDMMADDRSTSTSTGVTAGIHAQNDLGGGTVHLGSRSVMAYILGKHASSQDAVQALLEENMLPKLGLDNESVSYPFVDLWSSNSSAYDIRAVSGAVPDDQQCRELFACYRDIAGIIYPVIVDIPGLEQDMETFLANRTLNGNVPQQSAMDQVYGVHLPSIGLLFAVLASGSQSSNLPTRERELMSQVYICCAYQCLRMTNFVSAPTIEAIQTMMIICNALSYNMNPGISYIMLGMTVRMAISIGLQVESKQYSTEEAYHRRRVWWALAWQESHFSISYDRPTTLALSQPSIAYGPASCPGNRSYCETMCRIISLTFEIVRSRMMYPNSHMTYHAIYNYKDNVARIVADGKPHLREVGQCHIRVQHLERLALKLHASYITSELCRPALNPPHDANEQETADLRSNCRVALEECLSAYLELQARCHNAARSWIGIQRAFSSAFLLAVLEESHSDSQIWDLLQQLENVLVERTAGDGMFSNAVTEVNFESATGTPQVGNVAATMSKSLKALRKLNAAFRASRAQLEAGKKGTAPAPVTKPAPTQPVNNPPQNPAAAFAGGLMDPAGPNIYPVEGPDNTIPFGTMSAMPVTPDTSSTTSGEWNFSTTNLFERAEAPHMPSFTMPRW